MSEYGPTGRPAVADAEGAATETAAQADPAAELDGPAVVVVCGLPGVGKTTVARRIADRFDGEILRTDAVRKELFPEPEYTDEETEAVYDELLERARAIAERDLVVLDATFARAAYRERTRRMADETGVPFRLIKVECETAVVEQRIAERDGLSDADFDVHLMFQEEYEPVERDAVVVDNSGTEAETLARVDELF